MAAGELLFLWEEGFFADGHVEEFVPALLVVELAADVEVEEGGFGDGGGGMVREEVLAVLEVRGCGCG